MDIAKFERTFNTIVDNVDTVIHGKDDVVRLSLVAVCAGGHILFEDVPGVGKSMLARALGQSLLGAQVSRVQCTPDMLPGDITGSSIIDTSTMEFRFRPGPVFANVVLVDEVNRATPKTQSALLEAMGERSVTVDGVTHPLPRPFLVLATQNPVELAGTFPLPEAQLDRFLFKLSMGYPDHEAERRVLRGNQAGLEVEQLEPVVDVEAVLAMARLSLDVEISTAVEDYIIAITHATREDPALVMGASPRASIFLARAARVLAAADGRAHVYPEDVRALLRPTLGHRIMLTPDAVLRGETADLVLERVVSRVKPPTGIRSDAGPPVRVAPEETGGADPGSRARGKRRARPVLAPSRVV